MRAPTIEGYAARHSKLSKSVTFNKYTLQSPPSEQSPQPLPPPNYPSPDTQDQPSLPPPNKFSFRPVSSAGGILQTVSRPREKECLGELLSGVGEVIKVGLVSEEHARARALYPLFPAFNRRALCAARCHHAGVPLSKDRSRWREGEKDRRPRHTLNIDIY